MSNRLIFGALAAKAPAIRVSLGNAETDSKLASVASITGKRFASVKRNGSQDARTRFASLVGPKGTIKCKLSEVDADGVTLANSLETSGKQWADANGVTLETAKPAAKAGK